ncbi:hypothetical protein GCM10007416_12860 [Kroppenstedtia guangzhouensis]|uniref:DUF1002 domain-containing protein n=1 Tax=Kroppenstedtia guangzhouensis TaxID=1274356 RepID=A0ABQ1GCR7_9BACL|nr:DUF1002 domain-containing protein [Kroppenstedtia guangzhouensis]GGA41297.1 hypothetical protein GCM10007416_12860 [Kroppenstedtia guangzhouensis]
MNKHKRISGLIYLTLIILFFSWALPYPASADAVAGETVVTLGHDLTPQQKNQILQEMNVNSDVKTITVTNQEEHRYLGKYLNRATIGNRALSSAKITLEKQGTGIKVQTHNITTITEKMYANALITAGVNDAEVYVTAPMQVSGTAGLTGILKAFETASDQNISEEQKQVANEEMVRTSELGKKLGDNDKAAQFMTRVKEEIADKKPDSPEQVRDIIVNVAGDLNIHLNNQEINNITNMMYKFSQLDIDWDHFSNQLEKLKGNLGQVVDSKEAQGFFDKLWAWLSNLIDSLKNIFSS